MAHTRDLSAGQLQGILKDKQGVVCLHAIYDAVTREPMCHEVLLRLLNARGDEILPRHFIPAAVGGQMMPALDMLTLDVLETQFGLHRSPPPTRMSVNISRHSLLHEPYMQRLTGPLWGSLTPYVVLELKTGDISRDITALKNLLSLKSGGTCLCVDYQKGGVRAVELAVDLGFDYLKIDAMNVALKYNEVELANVRAACQEARKAGLKIIFERVETPGDYRAVQAYKPHYLQGFLFGQPGLTFAKGPYVIVTK